MEGEPSSLCQNMTALCLSSSCQAALAARYSGRLRSASSSYGEAKKGQDPVSQADRVGWLASLCSSSMFVGPGAPPAISLLPPPTSPQLGSAKQSANTEIPTHVLVLYPFLHSLVNCSQSILSLLDNSAGETRISSVS